MRDRLIIRPGFVALLCGCAYFGSAGLLTVYLLSAALHELGHAAAARALGLHLKRLTLSAAGAELELREQETSFRQDFLLCLSGPVANLAAAAICAVLRRFPLFLGANLLLGCFNLLPVLPLDGGNALFALLSWATDVDRAFQVLCIVSLGAVFVLTAFGLAILTVPDGKPWLALLGIWLLWAAFRRDQN